jgi:hypothetical protein
MTGTPIKRTLGSLVAIALVSSNLLFLPGAATAEVPLRQAVVQSLWNSVRLLLQNQSPRPAKVQDSLVPGDGISTAQRSRADLRFNDGSLARIGEQALFRFLPNTRTFRLDNGTVLLLIPRGRGQTRLQTPNVQAGIRGSALFIRYLPETDTTIVGALTTSGIEVTNRDGTQQQPLEAGQMAVVVKDRIEQVLKFDLRSFYETSSLVSGLNLSGREPHVHTDADLAVVQEETKTALTAQEPITKTTAQNPDFLKPPSQQKNDRQGNATPAVSNPAIGTGPLHPFLNQPSLRFPPRDLVSQPPRLDIDNVGRGSSEAPGLAGSAPGLLGGNPGRDGSGPPGLTRIPPGLLQNNPIRAIQPPGLFGNTPGQGNAGPPGLTGTAPGLVRNNLNQGVVGSPGLTGTAPGLVRNNLNQGVVGPPGLTGTAPGLSGNNPGRGNALPPGLSGNNPGRGNALPPGLSGNNPGRAGN